MVRTIAGLLLLLTTSTMAQSAGSYANWQHNSATTAARYAAAQAFRESPNVVRWKYEFDFDVQPNVCRCIHVFTQQRVEIDTFGKPRFYATGFVNAENDHSAWLSETPQLVLFQAYGLGGPIGEPFRVYVQPRGKGGNGAKVTFDGAANVPFEDIVAVRMLPATINVILDDGGPSSGTIHLAGFF